MFACRGHWFSLPTNLRDDLWHAYRVHGALSEEHLAAMDACSEWLKAKAAA
jgi:hypothetical protein